MWVLFVAFTMLGGITAFGDDLADPKAASLRYVAAMKAVLALSDDSDCFELVATANDYAAAKVAPERTKFC